MATYLFNYLFRRTPAPAINVPVFPYKIEKNPYRCKRLWPPDFTQLSTKHKFRLERRYKRRTKLKWARPTWTKFTKLAQWGSILFVAVYSVVWLDIDGDGRTLWETMRTNYEQNGAAMQAHRIKAQNPKESAAAELGGQST